MARSARQIAALRKAQAASARKRKGRGKGKLAKANRRARRNARIAGGVGIVAGVAVGYAGYKASQGRKNYKVRRTVSSYGRMPGESRFGNVKTGNTRGLSYRGKSKSYGVDVTKRRLNKPRPA